MKTFGSLTTSLALSLSIAAAACAAPTDDTTSEPAPQPELGSDVAPKAGCTGTQCYGDGDTGGVSILPGGHGPQRHCPTGKEIMDCVRHCSASHSSDPDACISSCNTCY